MIGMESPPPSPALDQRLSRELSTPMLVTLVCTALVLVTVAGFGPAAPSADAATPMVDLGQASTYAVLSGASVGNTVSAPGAPHTTLRGDLGVKANAQPTGFPPGVVTGVTRVGSAADGAHADVVAAYTEIAARTGGVPLAGALAGMTVSPGLHTIGGAASNTTTLTLDGGGDPSSVFVFQVNGALAFAAGSEVKLINGAQASRVFWQVNGAGSVGANAKFAGTLIAMDAVAVGAGTVFNGRAFARNGALTLDSNEFYSAPPVVTIAGGPTAYTTDTTPTISGTTDVEAPGVVTVTIAGETLTATPSNGAWSVGASILANGTYPITASVTDGAGNAGSATQQLTVDTVLPIVTLDEGPSVTNDPTPTVSGNTDVAVDSIVSVTVGSQNLKALVHPGGVWNVRSAALPDGTYQVAASVRDPAGNEGTDGGSLSIDTVAPALTIAGGVSALTDDATPTLDGTTNAAPGTVATVALADETLTTPVTTGDTWSVTAAPLSDGPHRVVVSLTDAAGNESSATQSLTVDTVDPLVAITGGPTATSDDLTPTIRGDSNAAPGSIVTVSIGGQRMTTVLQGDGGWNVTPDLVGAGTWLVVATVPDQAGNVGRATQKLTLSEGNGTPPPRPDTNPPETTITKGAPNRTHRGRVSFAFTSDEAHSTFECKLDKAAFKPCRSPAMVRAKRGRHVFKVRAIDRAGNVDRTPDMDRYRVLRRR